MELIKKINNNFALAKDSSGKLVIVSGRGIGFETMPCVLEDLSRISHTYYDVANRFITQIEAIPEDVIDVTSKAVKYANVQLKKELNPNLFFTLADHINFVIDRSKKGIHFNYGLSYEIRYLHPDEMRVAESIVNHINKVFNCSLPEEEIAILAMHILEAENLNTGHSDSAENKRIVKDILDIIKNCLKITFDENGFNYYRFASHIQYLIDRKDQKSPITSANKKIYDSIVGEFPETYVCVVKIKEYFNEIHSWDISDEELLYLMLHINRLCSKEDCYQ